MLALLARQLRRLGIVKARTSDADVLKVKSEEQSRFQLVGHVCALPHERISLIEKKEASCAATCLRYYISLIFHSAKNGVHTEYMGFNIVSVNIRLSLSPCQLNSNKSNQKPNEVVFNFSPLIL